MRKLLKNVSLAMVLMGSAAIPALADEDKVSKDVGIDEVSAKARVEIQKQVGKDGRIEDIDREHRGGRVVYQVEFRDKSGQLYEMVVSDAGKLLSKHLDS